MDASANITRFVTDFVGEVNSGKVETALARFSNNATIVEDIAPFMWQGPHAGSQWLTAMATNAKRLGVTSVAMELGEVQRIDVEERAAYAIFAGTVQLEQADRTLREPGLLTFALARDLDQWLITAMTWTGERPR
jgi:hypothetical protein